MVKTEGNPKIKSPCLFTILLSAILKVYTAYALIVGLSAVTTPRNTYEEAKWIIIVINRTTCHFV